MKQRSKKYLEIAQKFNSQKIHSFDEAISLLQKLSYAKFDETVDVAFRLGVDPKYADQMIRGSIALPAGTGKSVRICVIASGDNLAAAEKAGADFFGGDDIVNKIAAGWTDFDRVIATPDMMGKLGKIGRILGPRGLMPNPKLGTVTTDVAKAVTEQKAGKVEYRTDKTGIIHVPIGKKSFNPEKIKQNLVTVVAAIVKAKPASSKGTYLRSIAISTTMGLGIKLDTSEAINLV